MRVKRPQNKCHVYAKDYRCALICDLTRFDMITFERVYKYYTYKITSKKGLSDFQMILIRRHRTMMIEHSINEKGKPQISWKINYRRRLAISRNKCKLFFFCFFFFFFETATFVFHRVLSN